MGRAIYDVRPNSASGSGLPPWPQGHHLRLVGNRTLRLSMLRRAIAALLSLALLQPTLPGTGAACARPGSHEHAGAAAQMAMGHHDPAASHGTPAESGTPSGHHEGCPTDASAQGCLTMPACAGAVALPMDGVVLATTVLAAVVPPAPVSAPTAIARAPELPPPRA